MTRIKIRITQIVLSRCCGNGLWAANVVAASGGNSAALLRRCGGGCGKFERWCGVVLLWSCGCPASVPLQQLRRGWFCAWTRRLVGEGSRHPIIGGVFALWGGVPTQFTLSFWGAFYVGISKKTVPTQASVAHFFHRG